MRARSMQALFARRRKTSPKGFSLRVFKAFFTAVLAASLLCLPAGAAAPVASQELTPELERRLTRVVDRYRYDQKLRNVSVNTQWVPGQDRFFYWVSPSPGEGRWVSVDAATGAKSTPVEPSELRAQLSALIGGEVSLPINLPYAVDPGGKSLTFIFAGKGFSLLLATGRVSALPEDSWDAAVLRGGHQISGDRALLAREKNGGIEIVNRAGEVVLGVPGEQYYEWRLPEKSWATDGSVALAWRLDSRRVHKLPIVEYEGALERARFVPLAKAGTPLPISELYVLDPKAREPRRIVFTAEEGYTFLAGWRHGANEALLLHLSRDGKRLDLIGASPHSGEVRRILREERRETFVADLGFYLGGWQRQVTPFKDGFLWMSERDGWRHAYRYSSDGKLLNRVTRGRFPVHEILSTSRDGRHAVVLASANPAAPYDRLPYRVPLKGGELSRLSREPGVHRVTVSPTGRYLTSGSSTVERPTVREVLAADGSRSYRYEALDAGDLFASGYRPPEQFVAKAADGKTTLHGAIFKPYDFDPAKKYAVVHYVYGGPFATSVPHDFLGDADSNSASAIAQAGFVVVMVDARGSPGRGKAFQDVTYGRIGQIEIGDYVSAIRDAAATRPYMDLARIGITGHSWGGYFALRGILTAPEFYGAAYAGAPGALEEDAVVNEPNMGLQSSNPEGYKAGSNPALAAQLRGALKLMHGTSDTDASLSTTMLMAEALIAANKRFELLLMPGVGHSPTGAKRDYHHRDISLFFLKELGGPRP